MMPARDLADHLAGGDGGALPSDQGAAVDRIRRQLASGPVWAGVGGDAKTRLLEAAAQNPAPTPASLDQPEVQHRSPQQDETPAQPPVSLDRERRRRRRPIMSDGRAKPTDLGSRGGSRGLRAGSAILVAAAMAALGFLSADQLADRTDGPATVATYELAATPLDPDAVASADIKPTAAGVEIQLTITGLDNAEGPDYYSAWLMGQGEAIPVGSFHWRAGGVPVTLWSGVDDPSYDTLMVTRQTTGDGGIRSDQVVLMGSIPSLSG